MQARSSDWFSRNGGSPAGTYSPYERFLTGDEIPFAIKWMMWTTRSDTGVQLDINIATDPLGAPQEYLSDWSYTTGSSSNSLGQPPQSMAVEIPTNPFGGLGISVRQSSGGPNSFPFCIIVSDLGFPKTPSVINQSSGVHSIVSPVAADTDSDWEVLIPSLNFTAIWMNLMLLTFDTNANHTIKAMYDIGIGPPGFEVVEGAGIPHIGLQWFQSGNYHDNSRCFGMPVDFPAGEAVSIRVQDQETHSNPSKVGIVLYG